MRFAVDRDTKLSLSLSRFPGFLKGRLWYIGLGFVGLSAVEGRVLDSRFRMLT